MRVGLHEKMANLMCDRIGEDGRERDALGEGCRADPVGEDSDVQTGGGKWLCNAENPGSEATRGGDDFERDIAAVRDTSSE